MKKIIILIVVCVLAALVLTMCFSKKDEMKEQKENGIDSVAIAPLYAKDAVIKDEVIQFDNEAENVNLVIPKFLNLENEYMSQINSQIAEELSEQKVYADATMGFQDDEIGFFTYEVKYDRFNCGTLVSLVFEQYIHLGYGRPRIQKKCYVIDVQKNKTLKLKDVVDEENYEELILAEINKQAKDRGIELIGGNGLTKLNDEQAFYIKDNKLVIYFESSEIAATAVGELEFEMNFKLKNDSAFTV